MGLRGESEKAGSGGGKLGFFSSRKAAMAGARGDLCGSRTAKNVPLEHALWIYEEADPTGKSTRNREGGHSNRDEGLGAYLLSNAPTSGIFQGGRGLRGREIDADQLYGVGPRRLPGWGSTGCPVCRAFPVKWSNSFGPLPCSKGRIIRIGDSPRFAFGRGIRCRNPPLLEDQARVISPKIPRIGEQGGHFRQRTGCTS